MLNKLKIEYPQIGYSNVRDSIEQWLHDQRILQIARLHKNLGAHTVFADLQEEEWVKPPKVNGYVPDVYVASINGELIVEVETEDTEHSINALRQKEAFEKWENEAPNRTFIFDLIK